MQFSTFHPPKVHGTITLIMALVMTFFISSNTTGSCGILLWTLTLTLLLLDNKGGLRNNQL